jgi:hypothetical protein
MLIFQTKLKVILDIIFDSTLVGGWGAKRWWGSQKFGLKMDMASM